MATPTFTVETANRTLPLVRRIIEDLVRETALLRQHIKDREAIRGRKGPLDREGVARLHDAEEEIERLRSAIEGYVGEILEVGAEVKDFELGLVDFPGERNGKPILLCWKLGEKRLAWWHTPRAGFAGRQPAELLEGPTRLPPDGRGKIRSS